MFEYFYDNGKTQDDEWFVLSEDPKARVRVVFYDFESFEFLAPEFATKTLTGTQLYAGRGIKVTLPRGMAELRNGGSFASGRIYGEMQLVLQDPKKVGPLSLGRIIAGRSDVVETVPGDQCMPHRLSISPTVSQMPSSGCAQDDGSQDRHQQEH